MKRGILLSYVLLFAGFVLISLSSGSSVTGNAIFGQTAITISSIAGLAFIGASIGLFLAEGGLEQKAMNIDPISKAIKRHEKKKGRDVSDESEYLERAWNKYYQQIDKGNIRDFRNLKEGESPYKKVDEYAEQIMPEDDVEEFPGVYISKQAIKQAKKDNTVRSNFKSYREEMKKIAKDPDKIQGETIKGFKVSPQGKSLPRIPWHKDEEGNIYIDDLLYHEKENEYTKNWISKVNKGQIKPENYGEFHNLRDYLSSAA